MLAIYLFIGGTAALHKWNLKNPLDTDAAFRIIWVGTVTHDANGITPNGTTGYGDTKLNGSTQSLNNNSHTSVYSRTNTQGDNMDIGCYDGASAFWGIKPWEVSGNLFVGTYRFTSDGFIQVANTTSLGFYLESRVSSGAAEAYKNGASVGTTTTTTQAIPNANVAIGARGGSVASFSDHNIAFASIGTGLSAAEGLALYNAVQAYQTALGRNI